MYVCMYACVDGLMDGYVCVVYVCMHEFTHVCMCVCVCVCVCVCSFTFMFVYIIYIIRRIEDELSIVTIFSYHSLPHSTVF